ncbi:HTH-type transcriptional regulator LutR [Rubrobacter xylanophilus DSM 9941]|uniref:GntR family transcriptional regulator n=1 Tax=Rubrobacter xylanophilus TaxID=49319 RepID=UPI001C63BCB6|nr:GntR family transcriptional regulator [Rubrobacter xylanophilus]QYJ14253.1 HTH-type transcriptional regulator LutR [Rubrobacter xylanophilus DSM 9941]
MDAVSRPGRGDERIRVDSVVDLAYRRIRDLVLSGELAPGARLGQVELAERFGISRTPVREALRRLAGEGLVDQISNRGFRVADLGLDAVLRRLEVRALLEPGIARLAAERRSERDIASLEAAIAREEVASSGIEAHDASRDFHLALARATGNEELVRVLESLWIVEVGRRLLSRRYAVSNWQAEDVAEHRDILAAVELRRPEEAERLMAEHVRRAVQHWEPERRGAVQ